MLNIVIPMAGGSTFFEGTDYPYPKPLVEINGKPMIQLVVENLEAIKGKKKFIFIVNDEDCSKYHLDNTLSLLTDGNCEIIRLPGETQGAVCSVLMSINHIKNSDPLIIVNGDQIISEDLNRILSNFKLKKFDSAVITFDSVHPKWSYVRLGDKKEVVETAEKNPISKNAIAGFYYFNKGEDFVNAAFSSIEKESAVDGLYYIAPVINEFILEGKKVGMQKISDKKYHSFYSPQKISEYEKLGISKNK